MNNDKPPLRSLEQLTAIVLLAVVAALGWMILAAYWPAQFRLPSVQMEIVIILGLLLTALLLVSMVALLHTRT
ncbi:MAG TPA: hypothetical protein VGY58_11965 [Gemmataceae bacterium]|jgi:hypothetical protein|nr:hypothetical protein [Gemmataceae bacterium]